MTDAVSSTSGSGETTSGVEGAPGQANADKIDSKATFRTLDEMREKSPKLYQAMMEGIAMNIIRQMKRQQDHLKQIMRDARRAAGIR